MVTFDLIDAIKGEAGNNVLLMVVTDTCNDLPLSERATARGMIREKSLKADVFHKTDCCHTNSDQLGAIGMINNSLEAGVGQ